jgi:hypothetical protein
MKSTQSSQTNWLAPDPQLNLQKLFSNDISPSEMADDSRSLSFEEPNVQNPAVLDSISTAFIEFPETVRA